MSETPTVLNRLSDLGLPGSPPETETPHGMKRLEEFRGRWLALFSRAEDVVTTGVKLGARPTPRGQAAGLMRASRSRVRAHRVYAERARRTSA